MILWVLLFIAVVTVSFLLALRSMKDYQEIPAESQYGLFLVRNPKALNSRVLTNLAEDFLKRNLILSFERLFKGNKSTLAIFGPRQITDLYDMLDLLEIEDYTDVNPDWISAWEVGIRAGNWKLETGNWKGIFTNLPQLHESEHFWWQVVISSSLQPEIRTVLITDEIQRRKLLTGNLQVLAQDKLFTLPKAFSNEGLLNFYQKRSYKRQNKNPKLSMDDILDLIII